VRKELHPTWSSEQRVAGERLGEAWERFFSGHEETEGEDAHVRRLLDQSQEQRVTAVKTRHETELLRYPNVVGVATGMRTKQGSPTGEYCLVVYVTKKVPKSELRTEEILPRALDGIPVDVVETGEIRPLTT
jgi:hypothetical protein